MKNSNKSFDKIKKYLPTIIFCGFIFFIMIVFVISPNKSYSATEKRMLAEKPTLSIKNVFNSTYGESFEDYLSDHIPFRNFFTGVNAYYKLALNQNNANGVYLCHNGYIISEPLEYDEQLEINVAKIVKFADFFKENFNINTVVTVVPSTGYIMEDSLPSNHKQYHDEEFLQYTSKELLGHTDFVDLTPTFKSKKSNTKIYYKTDHHWTSEGAYIAYNELAPYLNITPTSKNDFTIETYDDFYGTTYGKGCYWLQSPDKIELWINNQHTENTIAVTIPENGIAINNSIFFRENLKGDDKYTVFIDGNHGYTKIINNDVKDGALLVVRDSFAHSISQFLCDNYHEIILVDLRYYKSSLIDIVKEIQNKDNLAISNILVLYGMEDLLTNTDISSIITNSQIKNWNKE